MTRTKRRKGINGAGGRAAMRCPYCSSPVQLRSADGIYKENDRNVRLYVCSKYPACDAYVRVHEGTTMPVGELANGKLRALRRTTHQQFDRLHESGVMTKDAAYGWLAYTLQRPLSQAHIGYLSEYYCTLITDESKKLMAACSWKLKKSHRPESDTGGVFYAAQ
jgi:ssDNA-binding Zn-finger/Zn-ribbon topoisomerase 1